MYNYKHYSSSIDSFIIFCAKYLIAGPAALVTYAWLKSNRRAAIRFSVAFILAGVVALLLVKLFGEFFYNPRPFITEGIVPLVTQGNDNGFPSEHTTLAMTLTSLLFFYGARKLALSSLAMTLTIGVGRVLADVHSPIDIAGGLVVGTIAGYFGWWLAKRVDFSSKT